MERCRALGGVELVKILLWRHLFSSGNPMSVTFCLLNLEVLFSNLVLRLPRNRNATEVGGAARESRTGEQESFSRAALLFHSLLL